MDFKMNQYLMYYEITEGIPREGHTISVEPNKCHIQDKYTTKTGPYTTVTYNEIWCDSFK